MPKNNNRLKELRLKHGYTLDDIESKTGIKRGTYSNYENHNTEPKIETWQKLANFFGVSVSYLQGLEPDLYKLIPETKELIISKLNTFYFDKGTSKLIDSFERVKNAINEYARLAQLAPLPNELKAKSQKEKSDYLSKYFSFLFEDSKVVVMANEYFYSYSTDNEKTIHDVRFANRLAKSIENHTIQEFETELGRYFNNVYGLKLQNAFKTFQRNISFCKSVEDISKQFDKFSNFLNTTQNELNSESFNRALLEKKIVDIVRDLMHKYDDLGISMAEIILNGQKTNKLYSLYDRIKFVKEYLVKNKKEVPKEISDYLERYSNK